MCILLSKKVKNNSFKNKMKIRTFEIKKIIKTVNIEF